MALLYCMRMSLSLPLLVPHIHHLSYHSRSLRFSLGTGMRKRRDRRVGEGGGESGLVAGE